MLYDAALFLDWTFEDAARTLAINTRSSDSAEAGDADAALRGPYLLLRNVFAVQQKRFASKSGGESGAGGSRRGVRPAPATPSQELFRRIVTHFDLDISVVCDVIAESCVDLRASVAVAPTGTPAKPAADQSEKRHDFESELDNIRGFVGGKSLLQLALAFERVVSAETAKARAAAAPYRPRRRMGHSRRGSTRRPVALRRTHRDRHGGGVGGVGGAVRICREVRALCLGYCCYFRAGGLTGTGRTAAALCKRLPALIGFVIGERPGAGASARPGGGAEGVAMGVLSQCTALVATREYSVAEVLFSGLVVPRARKTGASRSNTSRSSGFAPLFARRGMSHSTGRRGRGAARLALVRQLWGGIRSEQAREAFEEHLDAFLDGMMSVADEETSVDVLTHFEKHRYLGRFYLRKGTARATQASTTYKHLSTSLQILLEAAQHFALAGAFNHNLTSLELASLLKQRMSKLHPTARG